MEGTSLVTTGLENGGVAQSTWDITQKGCFAIAPPAKGKRFYLTQEAGASTC